MALAVALTIALAASCNGLPELQVAGACTLNSDCTAPLVCAFQVCHQQCTTSRDCASPDICVKGGTEGATFDVCQSVDCSVNQCPTGQTCGADDQCRDACTTAKDCIAGQVCVAGVCADKTDLSDSGALKGTVGDGGVGLSCAYNSDCGDAGLVCVSHVCQVQCHATIDCLPPAGPGGVCHNNVCVLSDAGKPVDATVDAHDASHDVVVPPDALGKTCNLPSDCPPGLRCGMAGQCTYECVLAEDCPGGGYDYCCVSHECRLGACALDASTDTSPTDGRSCKACASNDQCQDGKFCDGVEECTEGCCAPALDTPCDSHDPCVLDTCNEATMTCTHTPIPDAGGVDLDGDGHLAVGCNGGDDCNDSDPTVYPGHLEVFDGKDNDCNGYIDDHVAGPKGPMKTIAPLIGGPSFAFPIGGAAGDPVHGAWGYAEINTMYYASELFSEAWTVTGTPSTTSAYLPSSEGAPFGWFGAASGPTSSAVFFQAEEDPVYLVVLNNDLTLAGTASLPYTGANPRVGDVIWTGTEYFAAWATTASLGYFSLVDTTGTIRGGTTLPSAGAIAPNTAVAPAANGSDLALAYTQASPGYGVTLSIVSESGAIGESIQCDGTPASSHLVKAAAGMPGGFVVLWVDTTNNDLFATYVPVTAGVAGSPLTVLVDQSGRDYLDAYGTFDGVGATFLLSDHNQVVNLGYWNGLQLTSTGQPANPFELTTIASGNARVQGLSGGSGGRMAAAYSFDNGTTVVAEQVGYCSITGADCATGSDCCSGTCNAVVTGGPKAYSTCK